MNMLQLRSCLGVGHYWCLIPQLLVLIYDTTKGNCGGLIQNLCCRQLWIPSHLSLDQRYQVLVHRTVLASWQLLWDVVWFTGTSELQWTLWWRKVQACPSASLAIVSEFSCLLFNTLLHSQFQWIGEVSDMAAPCYIRANFSRLQRDNTAAQGWADK